MAEPQDFSALMREAEAAAGVLPDEEVYGRFLDKNPKLAAAAPEAPEAVTEPEPKPASEAEAAAETPAESAPPEKVYAGKFKSDTDLERGYLNLEQELGRMKSELGELRQQQDAQPDYQYPAQPMPFGFDPGQLDPEQLPAVVEWAYRTNQPVVFQQAMNVWKDEDPFSAGQWVTDRKVEAMQAQMTSQVAPAQLSAARAELASALETVAASKTDFAQVVGALDPDRVAALWQGNKLVERVFREALAPTASFEDRQAAYETLYAFAKAEQAGTLTEAAQKAAVEARDTARQAKTEAQVASASQTTPPETPITEEERMLQVVKEHASGMRDHWTGQDSRRR